MVVAAFFHFYYVTKSTMHVLLYGSDGSQIKFVYVCVCVFDSRQCRHIFYQRQRISIYSSVLHTFHRQHLTCKQCTENIYLLCYVRVCFLLFFSLGLVGKLQTTLMVSSSGVWDSVKRHHVLAFSTPSDTAVGYCFDGELVLMIQRFSLLLRLLSLSLPWIMSTPNLPLRRIPSRLRSRRACIPPVPSKLTNSRSRSPISRPFLDVQFCLSLCVYLLHWIDPNTDPLRNTGHDRVCHRALFNALVVAG